MNTPKFKANDIVVIIKPRDVVPATNQLIPADEVVGLVGVVRATFNYDTNVNDYDVALMGRKYRSHHQHIAVDECYLQLADNQHTNAA